MSATAARLDDVGKTIAGRYVVEEALGDGGMAAVYKVLDLRTDKRIALKRGLAVSGPRSAKRKELLEREFHTLAQLAHPRIIEVYDYGVDESGAYYTMELLDGADLHKSGRLPWRQVCTLLRDVASSLALLHSRGLIHRDVSARNVRCTTDGRAKLIDFGAMTPTGVAKDVAGTPPFLAPEVLQMQALDGRSDLFSLGALGYLMLTGQHAYPARRFRDLRDVWRSRPAPPMRAVPDVPPALSALILQLLALDRAARPSSAAEVMQRLSSIGGLPLEEHIEVSRAYLTSPVLVGRELTLVAVRRRMLSLGRGDGGSLLIQGEPGSGRSRMLDACALEAKLGGAAVLRADARDERHDWGVARVLGAQLVQLMPEQAADAARLSREVLSQVIDGLRSDGNASVTAALGDRSMLIRELRDFILSLARVQRLVIVVDDADQIDEQSAALLAAIAHKTERHPLILAIAVNPDSPFGSSASMRLLHLVSDRIRLEPLQSEQTEALLRSVFGDVAHLSLVAGRIHVLSQGNPRTIMELAQHLVDRNLARYAAGTWSLPGQLGERDLPATLSASLTARLATLSEDARELCEALCLADGDGEALSPSNYVELTTHRDQRRVFGAIDELIVARVLAGDNLRYRFSQRSFVTVLENLISDDRRRWLHARLADMLASIGGDVLRRAHHLTLCGRDLEAVHLLCSVDLQQRVAPLALLEAAVASAERNGMPARITHDLRRSLVGQASLDMAIDIYRRHAPILLNELERDAGLVRYRELSDVPEAERLGRAVADTQQRYLDSPERERIRSVGESIRALAVLCAVQRGVALAVFDKDLLDTLPSLAPLARVSPAIQLSAWSEVAYRDTLIGRFKHARESYHRLLERVAEPDGAGLNPDEVTRTRCGAHYVLGLIEAARGMASTEAHAQMLEGERAYRVNAWRVRALWHLTLGDLEESSRCRRRAELTLLQEGGAQQYAGTTSLGELVHPILSGDLMGVKQAIESVAKLAVRFPGWRPFLIYGECAALMLQGDNQAALDMVVPELARTKPAEHAAFAYLAAVRVSALSDLGRVEEAAVLGRAYVLVCDHEGLTPTGQVLHVAAALAMAKNGDHAEAVRLADQVIESAREGEQRGVCIGSNYEARARIAIWMHDREAFQHYADLCANEYQNGRNMVLAARLARLVEEARLGEVGASDPIPLPRLGGSAAPADSEYATIHSRILECADENERARCTLTILLQGLDSFVGYLFGVNEDRHVLLASLPEDENDPALTRWFTDYLAHELELEHAPAHVHFRFVDSLGRGFEPLFLTRPEGIQHRLAAVLIFQSGTDTRRRPSRELQEELATQLLDHGDVTGAVLEATGTQTRTH